MGSDEGGGIDVFELAGEIDCQSDLIAVVSFLQAGVIVQHPVDMVFRQAAGLVFHHETG